jgi:hypothetical protein
VEHLLVQPRETVLRIQRLFDRLGDIGAALNAAPQWSLPTQSDCGQTQPEKRFVKGPEVRVPELLGGLFLVDTLLA